MSSKNVQIPSLVRVSINAIRKALRGTYKWFELSGSGELARVRFDEWGVCPIAFRIGEGVRTLDAEGWNPLKGDDEWDIPLVVWYEGVRVEVVVRMFTSSGEYAQYDILQVVFYDTWGESLPDEILHPQPR